MKKECGVHSHLLFNNLSSLSSSKFLFFLPCFPPFPFLHFPVQNFPVQNADLVAGGVKESDAGQLHVALAGATTHAGDGQAHVGDHAGLEDVALVPAMHQRGK